MRIAHSSLRSRFFLEQRRRATGAAQQRLEADAGVASLDPRCLSLVRWTDEANAKRKDRGSSADRLVHGRRVYSELADDLIRKIVDLGGKSRIADMLLRDFNDFGNPDVPRLEKILSDIHNQLATEANARGLGLKD